MIPHTCYTRFNKQIGKNVLILFGDLDLQIDVYQVEEKGYYVRIVCNKGHGVAASLYKALESFSSFTLQSSNLATLNDTFLFTFTLNVSE